MPIDINNISNNTTLTKRTDEQKHVKIIHSDKADDTKLSTKDSVAQDSINFTDSARQLKALEEKINRLPIIDTQKVEQIKNSISDGTFDFNSERVAEKLLNFEQELF